MPEKQVRVLRVLEYIYPDLESYIGDKSRWTLKSPTLFTKDTYSTSWFNGMSMQSSIVSETFVLETEEEKPNG